MSPARKRALVIFEGLKIRWDSPSDVTGLVFGTLVEAERVRPIVEAAQNVVDADSGQKRATALQALITAVQEARKDVTK